MNCSNTCASTTRSASCVNKPVSGCFSGCNISFASLSLTTQSFKDYPALEKHFVSDHYPCPDPTCIEKKFVVFGSELDLRGHQVEEHGAHLTNKERRDVSRLEVNWNPPIESAQPAQTRSATGSGRRAAFGGRLTNQPTPSGQSSVASSAPTTPHDSTPVDPAVAAQHAMVIDKVMNFTKSSNAVQAFKFSIRAFKNNESTAGDLIQSLVSILKNNIDVIASIVSQVGILLDNAEKSQELDIAWKEYRGQNRIAQSSSNGSFPQLGQQRTDNFPSLAPSAAAKASSRALPIWERDPSAFKRPQRVPPGSAASSSHYPGLGSSSQPRTSTGWSSGGAPSTNRHAASNASNFPSLPSSDAVAKANAERRKLFQPHQQRVIEGQSSSAASSTNSESRSGNKKQQKKKQTVLTIGL